MIRTRPIRRVVIAVMLLAALAVSSVALAGGALTGKYSTTIKSPPDLRGTWALNLQARGTYTVALNGHVLARGKYAAKESTITFGPETGGGCPKSGKYAWKKSGKALRFTRISESSLCAGRAGVLERTFTQQR